MLRIAAVLASLSLLVAACARDTASPPTTTDSPSISDISTTAPATTTATRTRPELCDVRWEAEPTGVIGLAALNEISGAAASLQHEGVLWMHNDSGHDALVYAVDASGTELARVALPDLSARDWEDMAIGPGPDSTLDYLYLADIGDNNEDRDEVLIHRIPEPEPATGTVTGGETLRVSYPLGSLEAETLIVDPVTGDIVIAGKKLSGVTPIYGLSGDLDWSVPHEARYLGEIVLGTFAVATGGDAGTDRIVIRTYDEVFVWERQPAGTLAEALLMPPCRLASVSEVQGEAIALTPDELGFYTVSEGQGQPIYRFAATSSDGI